MHNSTPVLYRGSSGLNVVRSVGFIGKKVKSYACRYLKIIEHSINLALHTWIVVEHIAVKVTEFKYVLFKGRTLEKCSNVGLNKGCGSEGHKVLKMMYKEHNVPIVHVFFYRYYLSLSICYIEVRVEVS